MDKFIEFFKTELGGYTIFLVVIFLIIGFMMHRGSDSEGEDDGKTKPKDTRP